MKSFKIKLITSGVLAVVLSGISTGAHAAYGWNAGTVHSAASTLASRVATDTTTRIAKSQVSLQTAIQDNTAMLNEAIALNVRQEALSAATGSG